MALTTIDDRGLKTPIDLLDNEKIRFGTGNDIEIYHNSGQSYITNSTGNFRIDADHLRLRSKTGTEAFISASVNGAVELYYNDSKKFETTNAGVTVTGNLAAAVLGSTNTSGAGLSFADNVQLWLGTGDDLKIYHDGSNSYIKDTGTGDLYFYGDNYINFANAAGTENKAKFITNGAVELYYNNVKTFETNNNGIEVLGPEGGDGIIRLSADEGDDNADKWRSRVSASSGTFNIENYTSGSWESSLIANGNGNVELYYDNVKKLETTSDGISLGSGDLTLTGNINLADSTGGGNNRALFGASDDLQLFHDGSDSYVQAESTGGLYLKCTTNNEHVIAWAHVNGDFRAYVNNGEPAIIAGANAGVSLYYDNTQKFETKSDQVRVYGFLQAYEDITDSNYTGNDWHVLQSHFNNRTAVIIEHAGDTAPYGLAMGFTDAAPDNNSNYFINCYDSSTDRFRVYSDGDVVNHDNSYGQLSDVKLKENITDANSQWSDIKAVKVRNFNFKTDDPSDKQIGVIAQELETTSPGLILNHPDLDKDNNDLGTTTKSVKYSILYMKAIKALQEAMAKIETLEAKVAALESA